MSIRTSARPAHRTLRRAGVVVGAGLLTSLALTGVASAHVEITPASVPGGEDAVISFTVPTESDSASTVALRVLLPKNHPIGDVATTPLPGWTVTTTTRRLAKPIDVEGEKLNSVVSQVTWKATGAGIRPGQYQLFSLSLGGLPDKGTLVFNTFQTYSDGAVVRWNEVSADRSVEPEHPAPTLTLTAAESGNASADVSTAPSAPPSATAAPLDTQATPNPAATDNSGSSTVLATVLAAAALVVSLLTALLVWRRGSARLAPTPAPPTRDREDSHV